MRHSISRWQSGAARGVIAITALFAAVSAAAQDVPSVPTDEQSTADTASGEEIVVTSLACPTPPPSIPIRSRRT